MINSRAPFCSPEFYGLMGILIATGLASVTPAVAAQKDLDLIQSYVGDWRGRGTMESGEQDAETVVCRLDVSRSTVEKINYHGRCTLAGGNLSMNGTMAYISANNRYEAVMTSNTAFTGNAIGIRNGSNVTFDLQATDDSGDASNVKAGFGLDDGNIKVTFEITHPNGSKTTADIPFERR